MSNLAGLKELAAATDFFAVLATTRPDATVHASLVKAGVLDHPDTGQPSIGVVVGAAARKLGHLRHSGNATVVFAHGARWMAVEGPAQILDTDDRADQRLAAILRSVYIAAGGTHHDWDEFDRVMGAEHRCAVLVAVRRITTN